MSGVLDDGTACVIHIDDKGVQLEFDRHHIHPRELFVARDYPDDITVSLSQGSVATLTGVYRIHRSSNFTSAHEKYRANLTYIGPAAFLAEPNITDVIFRPTNERVAILYKAHRVHRFVGSATETLEDIVAGNITGYRYEVDVIDLEKCQAFEAKSDDLTVSGNVEILVNSDIQGSETTETRKVRVKYTSPVDAQSAIRDLITVSDYLSLMVGEVVSPLEVSLKCQGGPDKWGEPPTYQVFGRWRDPGRDINPQKGHRCIGAPLIDQRAYENALRQWMDRKVSWRQSYALGTICLGNQNEVSRRRLLDAAAWFESVPTFYERPRNKIARAVIAEASVAASAVFSRESDSVSVERAQALLGSVNATSLGLKIQDAVIYVRGMVGADVITPKIDRLASFLPKIRGKFAHGEDAFLGEFGHLVYEAILLFEVLAGVLTLAVEHGVLPKPDLSGHPLQRALFELQQFNAEDVSTETEELGRL